MIAAMERACGKTLDGEPCRDGDSRDLLLRACDLGYATACKRLR